MYGGDPYASTPYSSARGEIPTFDLDAVLAASLTRLVYTVTIEIWHMATNTPTTLYLASTEYVTQATDLPSSQPFRGVLTQPLSFRRSILGSDKIGEFTAGEGQIVWNNTDGAFDSFFDDYSVDGRNVTVRLGRIGDPYAQHQVIFVGSAVQCSANEDTVTATIRDFGFRLDVPVQPLVYAGTGGAEGTTDLAGKRRPISFGQAAGLPAIELDPANLIYEVSSNGYAWPLGMGGVYDRGVPLIVDTAARADYAALLAASVAAGHVGVSLPKGLIKLGADPGGTLFCNPSIGPSPPAYLTALLPSTSSLCRSLLTLATDLTDTDLDLGGFDKVEIAAPAKVDLYVGTDESMTVAQALAVLTNGISGWAGFNREGKLTMDVVRAPAGDPKAYFKHADGDIISLNRDKLPTEMWPPPWRIRVAYDNSEQTFEDFAGGVNPYIKSFFAEPYRLMTAEDSNILTDHPLAQDLAPIEANFDDWPNAQTEATRLLAFYSAGYQLYRMKLTRRAFQVDIGDIIHITHPRFGLSGGKLLMVVEMNEDVSLDDNSQVDQVEVVGYG